MTPIRTAGWRESVEDDPELLLMVPRDDVDDPELSIVIPALNEELTIGRFVDWCLDGLRQANIRGEIIIIDSSSDLTGNRTLQRRASAQDTSEAVRKSSRFQGCSRIFSRRRHRQVLTSCYAFRFSNICGIRLRFCGTASESFVPKESAVAQRLRNRHLIGRATPSVQMDCWIAA